MVHEEIMAVVDNETGEFHLDFSMIATKMLVFIIHVNVINILPTSTSSGAFPEQ